LASAVWLIVVEGREVSCKVSNDFSVVLIITCSNERCFTEHVLVVNINSTKETRDMKNDFDFREIVDVFDQGPGC